MTQTDIVFKELRRHELRHAGTVHGAWLTCSCESWRSETFDSAAHAMHVAEHIVASLDGAL